MSKIWCVEETGGEYDSSYNVVLKAYKTEEAAEAAKVAMQKDLEYVRSCISNRPKKPSLDNFRKPNLSRMDIDRVAFLEAHNKAQTEMEAFLAEVAKGIVAYPIPEHLTKEIEYVQLSNDCGPWFDVIELELED